MRYLRLWLEFFKMSWMADMEYRLNFGVRIVGEIIWYTAQLSVFEVLYTHTDTLNGWTISDVRIFMATLFLSDVFYMIFFSENLENISRMVRRGELDLYLVKPVNSQFMVTCRKIAVSNIGNLALVLGYFIWAVSSSPHTAGPVQWLSYAVLVFCGLMISYSMRFLFALPVLLVHEASNIQFIWYQVYRLGTRPDILYPTFLRYLVLTALPVAFIASVPARIIVEGMNWPWFFAGLGLSAGVFILVSWLWRVTLKHYASASS